MTRHFVRKGNSIIVGMSSEEERIAKMAAENKRLLAEIARLIEEIADKSSHPEIVRIAEDALAGERARQAEEEK